MSILKVIKDKSATKFSNFYGKKNCGTHATISFVQSLESTHEVHFPLNSITITKHFVTENCLSPTFLQTTPVDYTSNYT